MLVLDEGDLTVTFTAPLVTRIYLEDVTDLAAVQFTICKSLGRFASKMNMQRVPKSIYTF